MTDGLKALRINVTGRVQGVGFRYTAQQKAARLGLTGWVRNEHDGSVEMHCEGSTECIEAMLDWLGAGGPSYSRIDYMQKTPAKAMGTYQRFSVVY